MISLLPLTALLPLLAVRPTLAQDLNFTIAGGQVFTPGLVILDAPQPGTPLGGDNLHVALDVSTNGRMPLPPYADDSPSAIYNISMFLYSYSTGRNFTITNVTASANNASLGNIMFQEPGSTVKHINWRWPDCLVGNGFPRTVGSDRGSYNISIRQNYRLNGEDHYTIFDLPISVTNEIEERSDRPSCDLLDNTMMTPEQIDAPTANAVGILFAPGDSRQVEVKVDGDNREFGGPKPEAQPQDGLGSGAESLSWRSGARSLCLLAIGFAFVL